MNNRFGRDRGPNFARHLFMALLIGLAIFFASNQAQAQTQPQIPAQQASQTIFAVAQSSAGDTAIAPEQAVIAPVLEKEQEPEKEYEIANVDDLLADELPVLAPLAAHPKTSLVIVEQLKRNHYVDILLGDDISSTVLDNYLSALDPDRYYFRASDIATFEVYRNELDAALSQGDLDPAYVIFNLYRTRMVERIKFQIDLIHAGLDNLDFTINEQLLIDRSEAEWSADPAAHDDLWRRRLKAQVLGMKLNDKSLPEIAETLSKRYRNQMKVALRSRSEDAFQTYINAFARTYDPHTVYFSPRNSENFKINMSLSLEGIGAVLQSDGDATSVVRLVPAGPADKSGEIEPADEITAVGQGTDGPMIDVVGWRLDDVVDLIRGPKGSVVRLSVTADDDDGQTHLVSIVRNTIQLEEQAARAKVMTLGEGEEQRKIGVIEIPTFYADFQGQQEGDPNYRSTTRDVRQLIDALNEENIDAMIIDLRSNSGGSLQEANTMTGLFIPSGPTVQVKAARRRPVVFRQNQEQLAWSGPMAVVVNRLSASASEIFAGALQDYGRALVIGGQTFGKGTVQNVVPLTRGQLKLTSAKFYRVSGDSTQHQGVLPDIEFPALVDKERIGESTYDDALPWDHINAASFKTYGTVQPLLADLRAGHSKRAANDPHFKYYRSLMERSAEKAAKTHIILREDDRLAEKQQEDAWRLAVENSLRAATGKSVADTLDELEEFQDAEADAKKAREDSEKEAQEIADADSTATQTDTSKSADLPLTEDKEIAITDVDDDPMLEEAGRIVVDMINIKAGRLFAVPMTAKVYTPAPPVLAGTEEG